MEKKVEANKNSEFPIDEIKYSQNVEEMRQLTEILKDQMRLCPSEDIIFNLIETIDYYSLKRNFKIKSKSADNNSEALKRFRDDLLTDISSLETFTHIPTITSFEIEKKSNKGNKFNPPKIYDINGDETSLSINNREIILFLFDNLTDLASFVARNKNINFAMFCLSINMNFFETKKWIKNNGLLNNYSGLNFCFAEIPPKAINSATNLKLSNLPRISVIGADGIIREDKCIKNVNSFDVKRDLIDTLGKKGYNIEEQGKIDKFIYMQNDLKRKLVKSMNIYLKNNKLNGVHFYVKSKICIDKKGIKKIRCYPVFYGETTGEGRNMLNNLISQLNQQGLFKDIQCKVKYIQGK